VSGARHEGVRGSGCAAPLSTKFDKQIEISGQLHAPTALFTGEKASCIHWMGSWVGSIVGSNVLEKKKNPSSCWESKHFSPII